MDWIIKPEDLGILALVALIAVWAVTHKILNNRRQAVRHELHGTVTYTIKGYDGVETVKIARALRKIDEDPKQPDELEHRMVREPAAWVDLDDQDHGQEPGREKHL